MAPPNKSTESNEEDDNVGALIYRESQLRKAEAAAIRGKKSAASTHHHRSSTRKKTSCVPNQDKTSMMATVTRKSVKRKRLSSTREDGHIRKKVGRDGRPRKTKLRYCSAEGCSNQAQKGGVCIKHGAKVKRCSSEGCSNLARKGGVCKRHGAKIKIKHCSSKGCTTYAVKGGVCVRHGATLKRCSTEGCESNAKKGGVCRRHGAYRNTNDESTAFGSELEETTTATRFHTNEHASKAFITRRGGEESVPGEVAILYSVKKYTKFRVPANKAASEQSYGKNHLLESRQTSSRKKMQDGTGQW